MRKIQGSQAVPQAAPRTWTSPSLDTLAEQEQPGRLAGCSGDLAMNAIGDMLGNFLPCTKANPKQHAIAVVLGLVMVYGITNGLAVATTEGILTQLALVGVHLG